MESSKRTKHPYYILTPNAVTNLPKYKYNGVDRSLLYKYILSPLAGFLVDNVTPSTIAPNSITLFGLFLMLSSYLNIYYHCPTLEDCSIKNDSIPGYIFLINGIAMLIYQTLDNMDGKQSRKTGSSSPLGLLFDHGCDAINSIFGSVTWICAFGLYPEENLLQIWMMIYFPMLVFYVCTWEEYYTHTLDLPLFNGASEGLILSASFSFVSWWYGRSFWHGTEFYDSLSLYVPDVLLEIVGRMSSLLGISLPMQNYNIIVLATMLSAIREVTTKIVGVMMKYGLKTTKDLAPIIALMTLSLLIVKTDSEVFMRNERCCIHLVAMLFVEMVTRLMLDHTSGEKFQPFRKVLVPLFLIHCIVGDMYFMYSQVDRFIWWYTAFLFVYSAFTFKIVINEICDLLGIWCFDIVTPKKKKQS